MNISLPSLPPSLFHRSAPLSAALWTASIAVGDIAGRHWLLNALSITLMVAFFIQLLYALIHNRSGATTCPRCRPRSPQALARLHYRIALAVGRHGGTILWTAALAFLVASPFIFGIDVTEAAKEKAEAARREFEPDRIAYQAVPAWIVAAFLACNTLYRQNTIHDPDRPPLMEAVGARAKGLVHRSHWLTLGAHATFVLFIPIYALHRTPATAATLTAILVAVMAAGSFQQHHSSTLCEQCVTDWAITSDDLEGKKWRFRYIHRVQGKLNWLTLIAFLLVHFSDSPWAMAYFIPTVLASTVHAFMLRFHANYLPWCPYCREDGGEEEVADPVPDSPHGRPLPLGGPFPNSSRA
ncbi:hypothetical protein [Streptomyces albidoflavus]|uniref:hypothetical protein n=1 Tax=Streptomyces albidoflavus TaxID=1886 RepID=UPI0034032652